MTWPAVGRSARAASRSPPAPTMSRPSARPVRRTCSKTSPTRPPCSTPSSHEPPVGLSGGRARGQSTGGRSRGAASRAGMRRGGARVSRRHDRPAVRSGRHARRARPRAAPARVSPRRRHPGPRGARVEGPPLATREVPSPRRSGSPGRNARLGVDHPRAAGFRGLAAHRPPGGGIPARPGHAAPRMVSGDGRVARGGGRAVRDRARDRRHRSRPRPVSSRVAALLRGAVRSPHRPGRPRRPMSAPVKIPMPLRVPEIAPSLGRVLVPRRLEDPWVPLDDIREELATRVMELAGEALVAALDALDGVAGRVREASVLDKAAHADWQEALRTAARRLEAAWLALETQVADEQRRWADEIDAVTRWRPSLWPLLALWAPLAVALVWLGLVLGGYLPAPAWLASRLGF